METTHPSPLKGIGANLRTRRFYNRHISWLFVIPAPYQVRGKLSRNQRDAMNKQPAVYILANKRNARSM